MGGGNSYSFGTFKCLLLATDIVWGFQSKKISIMKTLESGKRLRNATPLMKFSDTVHE